MAGGFARRLTVFIALLTLAVIAGGCGQDNALVATSATLTGNASATCTPAPSGAASPAASAGSSEGTASVAPKKWNTQPAMQLEAGKDYGATLKTSMGDIVIDLDEQGAPITVNNFVFLAEQCYYENVPFHRVLKGFVIQTGDPTGTGAGGPGYKFNDEPVTKDYTRGTLAMANAGPNTNGSQFFICQADLTGRLPKNYTIFGTVTAGMDVVDAIANVPVGMSASGEQSSPLSPVTLESVTITTK